MKTRIYFAVTMTVFGFASGVQAQTPAPAAAEAPSTTLTLADAVNLALRLQPSLEQARESREASLQRLQQRKASYAPTVTPEYTYTRNYTLAPTTQFVSTAANTTGTGTGTGTGLTTVTTTTTTQERVTESKAGDVSLSYRLFDSGTRDLNNRQARQNLRASSYSEENTHQGVIATVASYYYTVLRNNALVRVSESQVARAQNTLAVVQAQVEAGAAARKDVYQSEADLLNAQVNLAQARNDARVALAQLKQAIGLEGTPSASLRLADVTPPVEGESPTLIAAPPEAAVSVPLGSTEEDALIERLTEDAYKVRPDVRQAQQNAESFQTGVRLAQVSAGMQVSADVGTGYTFSPYSGNDRKINLVASYPLFDGGLVRAQVREARANARSSASQIATLRQQVAVDVEQAYRTLTQAQTTLPSAASAQRAAQINYDAALASRREGVGSIVEVITAQTSLVQAQTNYVNALYSFYSADAALARAVGQTDRIGGGAALSKP